MVLSTAMHPVAETCVVCPYHAGVTNNSMAAITEEDVGLDHSLPWNATFHIQPGLVRAGIEWLVLCVCTAGLTRSPGCWPLACIYCDPGSTVAGCGGALRLRMQRVQHVGHTRCACVLCSRDPSHG